MVQLTTHRIAGVTFLTDSNSHLSYLQGGSFKQFVTKNMNPDVQLRFHRVPPDVDVSSTTLYRQGKHLLQFTPLYSRLLAALERAESISVVADGNQVIVRDFSECELDYFYRSEAMEKDKIDQEIKFLDISITTFRQVFSTFLPVFSAALIHSSCIMRHNLAAMFLAPSTGGKTTVVKTINGDYVLSDDQVILRKEGDTIWAHGTPFGKLGNGPLRVKLGGLFLLEKAERFELTAIKPVDVLQYLWSAQLIYTFFLPADLRAKAYQMLYMACHQAPCYLMRFHKDYVDWDAIDLAMAK
jgi:hypothetical protein